MTFDGMFQGYTPPKEVKLWPVQEYILGELRTAMSTNNRVILMAPTGLGKTQISIQIMKQAIAKNKTVCFTCHRISLVEQTSLALESQGQRHGVIQGQHPYYYPNRPIQVCSIQTLAKRKESKFDLYIFDEIHVMFKAHEQIMERNPDAYFIGLSATPMSKNLGKYFTKLVHPVSLKQLIGDKSLKRFDIYGPNQIDLSKVRTVAGEWKKDDLEAAADKPKLTADIVATWIKLAKDRRTIVFSTSVGHGRKLEREFIKNGINAREINGYMRKETVGDEVGATEILKDFRENKFQVIISCEMLVAGFDVPDISCVVFATSTKSKIKWLQAVGRGLRRSEGLEDCLILDHGGITERLGFPDDIEEYFYELDDGKKSRSKRKQQDKPVRLPKLCPSCAFLKPPGVMKCPACGFLPQFIQNIEVAEGELKKIQRKTNKTYSKEEKQSFLNQLNTYCSEKGWSSGAAAHKYKAKFGVWPNKMEKGIHEPVGEEVAKFIQHQNIKYIKSKEKTEMGPSAVGKKLNIKEPCRKCQNTVGVLSKSGPHMKLSCDKCGLYIKFVSLDELKRAS